MENYRKNSCLPSPDVLKDALQPAWDGRGHRKERTPKRQKYVQCWCFECGVRVLVWIGQQSWASSCGGVLVGSCAWRVFPHPSLISAHVGISRTSIPPVLTCRLSTLSTELIYIFCSLLYLQTTEFDGHLPVLCSIENTWEELSNQLALSAPRDADHWMPLCFIPLHCVICWRLFI